MSSVPALTATAVKNHFYTPYFERGLNYYKRDYVFDTIRRGNVLEARCSGSMPQPYRVRATFSATGLETTDCTCPIGGGCKHAAALLLTWVHHPQKFTQRQSIDEVLAQRDKKELTFLIKEMLKREPDLELLLDMPLPGKSAVRKPIDPEPYRRQVCSAFYGAHEWNNQFAVVNELGAVVKMADQFADAGDWANARTIYQVVVEEGLENYEQAVHDEGEILAEINDAVEGLVACLSEVGDDAETRRELLRTLFDVISWDIKVGGYGVGEAIPDVLFEQTNTDEHQLLRDWIMSEAGKADKMESYSRNWRKEAWGRLLLQLDEQSGDVEGFLGRAKSQGMYRPLFNKLVELGRVDEAVEVAVTNLRSSDYDFLQSARALEAAGHPALAVSMVEARQDEISDDRLLAWLAERYEARGDSSDAFELQLRRWESRPSLDEYKIVEHLARKLNQWPAVRSELINGLSAKSNYTVLARIHLYEEDWDAAWEAANQQKLVAWGGGFGVREEVAKATEKHRPQQAIEVYLARAEALIASRGRDNYASAAQYLHRVRQICRDTGQPDAWQRIIGALRDENRNLPALKDELNKAKL